jgi:hypothetical protein
MKTPQEFMNKPLFEARLTYDEFTGRGKEMWDVTFTTSNGKGITKTRGMVGLPVGSKMGDIAKLWKKNHKSQKFVSAKYKGIREFSELVEAKQKPLTRIPTWPAQWVKGSIRKQEFKMDDPEEGYGWAQSYIAQLRKKSGNWIVVVRSGDWGFEDISKVFTNKVSAEKTFNQLKTKVDYGKVYKLLRN